MMNRRDRTRSWTIVGFALPYIVIIVITLACLALGISAQAMPEAISWTILLLPFLATVAGLSIIWSVRLPLIWRATNLSKSQRVNRTLFTVLWSTIVQLAGAMYFFLAIMYVNAGLIEP